VTVQAVPTVDDLAEMVAQVWSSYLDPDGTAPLVPTGSGDNGSEVHSSVSITGTWQGAVVFGASALAARRAAAAFLVTAPEAVSQDDVADVLGELANILGGNVKGMLPPGCLLSLPQVVLAPDSATRYPSADQVSGLSGTWLGEPVSVTMWQRRSEAGPGRRQEGGLT
jgi:chemotaxis protein CheX